MQKPGQQQGDKHGEREARQQHTKDTDDGVKALHGWRQCDMAQLKKANGDLE
jgi:hypothetical protein